MEETNTDTNFVLNSELHGSKEYSERNRTLLEKHIEGLQKEKSPFRDPINPEVERKIPQIRDYLLDYFSSMGIENVNFPAKITQADTLSNFGNLGKVDITEVVVHDFLDVKNLSLRRYLQARMVLHEVYHFAGPFKLADSDSHIREERTGLAYDNHDGVLEEAMAVRFELESEKFLKETFPEGYEKHQELISSKMENSEIKDKIFRITSQRDDSNSFEAHYMTKKIINLYEKLKKEVPDFDRLVEEARVNHKTIGLARAIEKVYGRGYYRELMTLKYEEIDQFLD